MAPKIAKSSKKVLGAAWGASCGHSGARDRQEEPQETPRWTIEGRNLVEIKVSRVS